VPSGQTLRGVWAGRDNNAPVNGVVRSSPQFQVRAPAPVLANQVNFAPLPGAEASDSDATCTGTAAEPTAPAGKVCLYRTGDGNAHAYGGFQFGNSDGGSTFGFEVEASATAAGDVDARGTWAYTAP
jgi:hypothetical protein